MPNRLEEVSKMVLHLKAEVDGYFEPEALMRFEICVTEALSNLTIHADTRDRSAPVDIRLTIDPSAVAVDIFDPVGTKPFDLKEHAVALSDVETTAESGRGLGLILECADSVTYGPSNDRNRLSLNFLNTKTRGQDA
jgi:serine/threonine-protein kinase RsbW